MSQVSRVGVPVPAHPFYVALAAAMPIARRTARYTTAPSSTIQKIIMTLIENQPLASIQWYTAPLFSISERVRRTCP